MAHRLEVEGHERLGRGHDTPPAATRRDELDPLGPPCRELRLVVHMRADRLVRCAERRVVRSDEDPAHQRDDRTFDTCTAECITERVRDREADGRLGLSDAPVERHRRDDVPSEFVLDQEVADLRAVAVGDDELEVDRCEQMGHLLHRGTDRRGLLGRGTGGTGRGDRVPPEREHDPGHATTSTTSTTSIRTAHLRSAHHATQSGSTRPRQGPPKRDARCRQRLPPPTAAGHPRGPPVTRPERVEAAPARGLDPTLGVVRTG